MGLERWGWLLSFSFLVIFLMLVVEGRFCRGFAKTCAFDVVFLW